MPAEPPPVSAARRARLAGLLTAETLGALALLGTALGLFFYLTRVVFQKHSVTFDDWGFAQMDGLRASAPGLTRWVRRLTFFGSVAFFVPASLLLPWLLRRRGHARYAVELLLSMGGGLVLNELLKAWFQRPRPTSALIYQYGLSFPSGHAMMSVAFYGCLAWLTVQHGRHRAAAAVWALALLGWAALIGLSRVYLHVHYLTDVVAGFAAGAAWLGLLRLAFNKQFWSMSNEQ